MSFLVDDLKEKTKELTGNCLGVKSKTEEMSFVPKLMVSFNPIPVKKVQHNFFGNYEILIKLIRNING